MVMERKSGVLRGRRRWSNRKNLSGVGLSGNTKAMWLDSYFHAEVTLERSQAKGFRGQVWVHL